ncbi:hypothetical protein BGZ80_002327 [Entomortierella chlamydospora]|uniref:Amino acid transporter transmembrane domain-containing protein n=1 Tax=Entomortierella chlamydospora TaxID=101097 RepID=A0A9P6T324_9FUNG|nr:hypothetical protein BGZ80_002327 [Entomortierella chlamydospora]
MDNNINHGNNTSDITHSLASVTDESHHYQGVVTGTTMNTTSTSQVSRHVSSDVDAVIQSNTGATNSSYHQYSESDNESGSDITAMQSNKNMAKKDSGRTNSGFDPDNIHRGGRSSPRIEPNDEDESDVDLDFGYDRRDYHEASSKVPLVSYKSKNIKSKAQSTRQGEYGRISNDSFHSGDLQEHNEDNDEDDLNFGEEEEAVGMMTGNRTNRSGIGNRHTHEYDSGVDAKLPSHGGSLFSSFLNMANNWTVQLLVHCGKLSGRNTYQDLLMFCFGKAGLIMISMFQFIFAFGGIETGTLGFVAKRPFVITFCTVLISFPLSLYRDISKLAKTSAIAMLALVVIIIAVIIEGPRAPTEIRGNPDQIWTFARPMLFQSIGVISFAFVCHHNSFLIFASLQKPTLNRVKIVTHMSMAVSLFACLVLALSGYISFSDKTQGNILNNFPSDNFVINIARFCFGVNMFTTLPLEAFVIETYYFAGKPFSMKRHVIITTGLVGIALLIALVTCDLGFVLEITGGFSATALAFILPPLCYLKLASGPIWSIKKLPHISCLGFGIAVMILSTFYSLQHFFSPPDSSTATCM